MILQDPQTSLNPVLTIGIFLVDRCAVYQIGLAPRVCLGMSNCHRVMIGVNLYS